MIEIPAFSLEWLNQNVPLWVAALAAFTAPYRWAGYAHAAVDYAVSRYTGDDAEN